MKPKHIITFAGAVGSSKSPIANYLSTRTNLPIFNNDNIRTEVAEDLGHFDEEAYKKIKIERFGDVLARGVSFIFDASVDRDWLRLTGQLTDAGYDCFVISLDLSYELLMRLYVAKNYTQADRLPLLMEQHESFLTQYTDNASVHINDTQFSERLIIADEAVQQWLGMR